ASCLKRMPDFTVTSSNPKVGEVAGVGVTPSNLAAGAAARAVSRNDRRLIFEIKLSLFSANRRRSFASKVGIFFGKSSIAQPGVHLAEQAVNLQIDDASLLRACSSFFCVRACLLIVLHPHVELCALVPDCADLRRRFDSAIEMAFAATQVITLCQKSAVVVIEKSVVISPGLIHLQPFLV